MGAFSLSRALTTTLAFTSSPSPKNQNMTPKQSTSFDDLEDIQDTYNRLARKLRPKILETNEQEECHRQYWVGIAGGPGSGKTTSAEAVAKILNDEFPDSAVVIPMDGWHIPQKDLVEQYGEDAMLRRGAPWTFDAKKMFKELSEAKEKHEGSLPIYDRKISNPRLDGVALTKNHKIVFVEGLYLLYKDDPEWSKLCDMWDERWFVRAPSREIQRERLIKRSIKTWSKEKAKVWGEGEEGATKRVDANDQRNMDLIMPHEKYADEVIITH